MPDTQTKDQQDQRDQQGQYEDQMPGQPQGQPRTQASYDQDFSAISAIGQMFGGASPQTMPAGTPQTSQIVRETTRRYFDLVDSVVRSSREVADLQTFHLLRQEIVQETAQAVAWQIQQNPAVLAQAVAWYIKQDPTLLRALTQSLSQTQH